MRTGFIVLAHERLDLVAQLVEHLSSQGARVVVHIDQAVPEQRRKALVPDENVRVISTQRSEWGMFGLVAATLDAVREILRAGWPLRHVALLSGSCLPKRSIGELERYLAANPVSDFIESVPLAEHNWVAGGLSEERLTLYHPFPWKRYRTLFDAWVWTQRQLGIRRRLPHGLSPHIGLQWWCLRLTTLRAIAEHPRLSEFERFFRVTWIPDEIFFQSLVRAVAPTNIVSRPLTLQRFDPMGQPYVFHDDHQRLLGESDHFFARKIDHDASQLRDHLLSLSDDGGRPAFWSMTDEDVFSSARRAPQQEHRGLITQGRLPHGATVRRVDTARPYLALVSDDEDLLCDLRNRLLAARPKLRLHGQLFGPRSAQFRLPGKEFWGNLPSRPGLRDYRPEQFLTRLIWAERDIGTAFLFDPSDNARIGRLMALDRNARLVLLPVRMTAAALTGMMRRSGNGRHGGFYAYHRTLDAESAEQMSCGARLSELADILASDWSNTDGWTMGKDEPR